MLTLLGWAIAGLFIGAIARLLIPGEQPMGCLTTMLLGIAGAIVGGTLSWLFTGRPGEAFSFHWPGWLLSILGAVLVLGLYVYSRRHGS